MDGWINEWTDDGWMGNRIGDEWVDIGIDEDDGGWMMYGWVDGKMEG